MLTIIFHPYCGTAKLRYRGATRASVVTSEIELPMNEAVEVYNELREKYNCITNEF